MQFKFIKPTLGLGILYLLVIIEVVLNASARNSLGRRDYIQLGRP